MNRSFTSWMKRSGIFSALCISSVAVAQDAHVGQVVSVTGKVLVRSEASKTMQMTFLKPGDKLMKGSIVNTGSNGSAKLMMTDKTIIDLGPSSLFKLNDYQLNNTSDRKVDISVDYGQVRASVNQKVNPDKGKFTIRTKAATMGVRGTEFVVNAGLQPTQGSNSAPQTSVTVIKGQVAVADLKTPNAPISVSPGMRFVKAGDAAPQVAKLDQQQLAAVRTEAFQKDMTFLQAVVIEPAQSQNEAPAGTTTAQDSKSSGDGQQTAEGTTGDSQDGGTAASGGETTASADGKSAPAEGSAPPPPPAPTGNLTMAAIVENVAINTTSTQPMKVTDLAVPGMMTGPMIPPSSVQIIQGLPKNLRVIFTP